MILCYPGDRHHGSTLQRVCWLTTFSLITEMSRVEPFPCRQGADSAAIEAYASRYCLWVRTRQEYSTHAVPGQEPVRIRKNRRARTTAATRIARHQMMANQASLPTGVPSRSARIDSIIGVTG